MGANERGDWIVDRFTEDEAVAAVIAVLNVLSAGGSAARARNLTSDEISFATSALRSDVPASLVDHDEPAEAFAARGDALPFAPIALADGRHAVPIRLPFGQVEAARFGALAARAEELGADDIRPAPHRLLLVLCPSPEAAVALLRTASELGFVTAPGDRRLDIVACTGAPACGSALIAARGIAADLAARLDAAGAPRLSIHISGCAKSCASRVSADLTVVGDEKGAGLVANGTPAGPALAYRSPAGLAEAIADVAASMRPGGVTAETLAGIWRSPRWATAEADGVR